MAPVHADEKVYQLGIEPMPILYSPGRMFSNLYTPEKSVVASSNGKPKFISEGSQVYKLTAIDEMA